jgi:tetratricopeptide (TPR) repeat protein
MLQENYLRAAQIFERIAANPGVKAPLSQRALYLGALCRIKLGQAAQAVPGLQRLASSEIDPVLRVGVYDALSEAHRASGQFSESLHALQAVQRMPRASVEAALKYDDYLFKLGCAYFRTGDRARANEEFRQILHHWPGSLRCLDASLRIGVKGFGVRVGEALPASDKPGTAPPVAGFPCSYVKVNGPGRPPVMLAVVSGLSSYEEAVRAAQRISREGVRAEPLP